MAKSIYKTLIILSTPTLKLKRNLFRYSLILILVWGSIVGLILPSFGSIHSPQVSFAQEEMPKLSVPEDFEGAKELGEKFLEKGKEELPGILEKLWQEQVLPIWRKMYEIWSKFWDSYILPWLQNIWGKIKGLFLQEIEKRKPQIEEEFQKEKQELKEELPGTTKSLWEKLKEFLK